MSTKQRSAIAFDMGLEKGYNKPAQTVHGIIGYTLRSEAVALWNVLKHEKDAYVRNLKEMAKVQDNDNTTEALVRYIDYTKERGYDTKQLLEFELSDSPLYLVNENIKKDGLLTKSAKAQLANELKKLSVAERNYQNCSPDMVVFDFMGIVRELTIKTMIPKIQTLGELLLLAY